MFFYFYDTFINEKRFESDLIKTENRLIDLGINGRIEKLTILRNGKELIEEAIKNGAHTIVAVGDDNTLLKVINIVADHSVAIGFIPLRANSKLARILGIKDCLDACDILSKRLVKKINLGKANQNYFFASISIPQVEGIKVECDEKYKVSLKQKDNGLAVYNLGNFLDVANEDQWKVFSNKNYLNVYVLPPAPSGLSKYFKTNNPQDAISVFPAKKIKISAEGKTLSVILDQQTTLKTPVQVTIKPKKINLIVGRHRKI
ncbi:MAG: diacylglycerol kinase family protein [Patescibacteria group bacterium]|jgi:diacylglycerol kinase family enzyme